MDDHKHFLLVEHVNNLNSIITTPLQGTQRIKFTCFDVSHNFIVFGATSGGLYVYNRFPCTFIKLIPNKHGSVVEVAIAPNEKTLALSTSKGFVVVIQNCQTEGSYQYQVYSEHCGHLVTILEWHVDDLYCGDNKGKVSVISVPNLLTKAIFQSPCASLMQLDSCIVQINCYSKYLVISTLSRTYLCDTEKEQYRQVGKKLREGNFGGCFFVPSDAVEEIPVHKSGQHKRFFKTTERFDASATDGIKIFCSRPGARMWEAHLDASVARTHQFKNYLTHQPSDIVHVEESNVNARLKISHFDRTPDLSPELINFTKVFVLGRNFIITFNKFGFYVFDPENPTVIAWCNRYRNVEDLRVVNNFIYVRNKQEVYVLGLYDLEKLVLKTLFNKQYRLCGEICTNYLDEVLALLKSSEKIHLVTILKEKLAGELLQKLESLFKAIEQARNDQFTSKKLTSGIFVVNNPYTVALDDETEHELPNRIVQVEQQTEQIDSTLKIFLQQFEWSKLNKNVELTKFTEAVSGNSVAQNIKHFEDFVENFSEKSEATRWSFKQFLKYLSKVDYETEIANLEMDSGALDFVLRAFYSVNPPSGHKCSLCPYPLPSARTEIVQYYEIGCELLKKFTNTEAYAELKLNTPYMWKAELKPNEDIDSILPLLIQFSDGDVIETFLKQFMYDTWDVAVQFLIKLKNSTCLNCDCAFSVTCDCISWTRFSTLMVQSIGAPNTLKLLTRYSNYIPAGELDSNFYQKCIFVNEIDSLDANLGDKAVRIADNLQENPSTTYEFDQLLVRYLQKAQELKPHGNWSAAKSDSKCSVCDLPLDFRFLNSGDGIKIKNHHKVACHEVCMRYSRASCEKHNNPQ